MDIENIREKANQFIDYQNELIKNQSEQMLTMISLLEIANQKNEILKKQLDQENTTLNEHNNNFIFMLIIIFIILFGYMYYKKMK